MCIINNTYGFIFVHIPKCGGSSVNHTLSALTTYQDIELGGTPFGEKMHELYSRRYKLAKHSTAREVRSVVGHPSWKRMTTFTLVRNPYARTISCFTYLKQYDSQNPAIKKFKTVNDFVQSDYWEKQGPDRMFESQVFWTRCSNADYHSDIDYIGRLEEIEAFFTHLFEAIRLSKPQADALKIEKKNASKAKKQEALLDSKSAERILNRYKEDFRQFSYPEALPAEFSSSKA